MNFMGQTTPRGVKLGLVITLVVIALAIGFVLGSGAERWIHDTDIRLGQCVPISGMRCLDAINKK